MLTRLLFSLFLLQFITGGLFAQQATQTLRGQVIDQASNAPVADATVVVLGTNPMLGTSTDSTGYFKITGVPVGRYDVKISYLGYEPTITSEVEVRSAKETVINPVLKQSNTTLGEVVVRAKINKEQPLNAMATVSARMLSVEEAKRYAGGFDDPARLASSFAGVASNNGNNGIAVRGNNPKFLQWKMEGVEIPNPNHFADLGAFGGGGITALSTQMLANSDFLTGAFPAEYGNAVSGVFDIFMRTGNNQKHEHTFQLGIIGIDAASEGPFKKGGSRSSYIFNYRYSTLALITPLLPKTTDGVSYQDLSFKFNFPTKKVGTFSFWGIGLLDHSGAKAKTDSTKWFYNSDKEDQDANQYMGAAGLTHKFFFGNNVYWKTNLAATVNGIYFKIKDLDNNLELYPKNEIANRSWNFVLSSFVNTRLNPTHTNRTGVVITGLMYNMLLKNALQPKAAPQTMVDENGFSTLLSAYTNSMVALTDKLTMNAGVNVQVFTLNYRYTVEPRLGFKWQFKPTQSLGLAYGMHSRLERLNYYFTKDLANNNALYNKDLDFTKAHHLVISYDLSITEHLHFKAEAYFQQLTNVPVIADSSFSFINLQSDWFFNNKLQSTGQGRNYGLDLTLEKYMSHGYYFMFTASVFNSQYKGGDNIWRHTKYNKNYLLNFLIGKEWQVGKNKQSVISANVRLSYQGGDRYTPVNTEASITQNDIVFNETQAFSKQTPPSFLAHFTASYKINKKKTAHEFAIKLLNAAQQKDYNGYRFNYIKQTIDENSEAIFIPNISYKIEF
jgi:hypothetical protein